MPAQQPYTRWLITYDAEDDVLVLHPSTREGPGELDLVVMSGGGVAPGIAVWRTHGTRQPVLWLPLAEV